MPGGNAGVCHSETSLERWYQFKQPTPTLQPNIDIIPAIPPFQFMSMKLSRNLIVGFGRSIWLWWCSHPERKESLSNDRVHSVLNLNFYHHARQNKGHNLSQTKNYYPHLRSKMSDEESEQQGDASCGSDGVLEQPTVRMLTFMV